MLSGGRRVYVGVLFFCDSVWRMKKEEQGERQRD